jgi:4-hydroxy-tetrahydrodipicolinate synthase
MRDVVYQGAWPVLITPYNADGNIDFSAYRDLLRWYLSVGVGGFFANCLSSDMFSLERADAERLVALAVEVSGGAVPVVATGSIGPDQSGHIEWSGRLSKLGVDVVMLLQPEFCRDEPAIERYYMAVAESVDVDLGLYECPVPQRRLLSPELIGKLAHTGRFVAYKETSCEIATVKAKLDACRNTRLKILQANLPILQEVQKLGGAGTMGIIVNAFPDLTARCLDNLRTTRPICDLWCRLCLGEAILRLDIPLATRYVLGKRGLPVKTITRRASAVPEETAMLIDTLLPMVLG